MHAYNMMETEGDIMTGRPHRFARRDENQKQIVADLERLGFYVVDTSPLGGQVLDIFVAGWHGVRHRWEWLHVEIKTARGKLTEGEARFFERCPECPAIVARSTKDIVEWFTRIVDD